MQGDFHIGAWLVQPQLHTIARDGQLTHVEPKAMQVLVYLAEHPDQVVPKERLISAVWADTFVTDDVLTRCISELRKAFDDDAKNPKTIETIPRSGYRLLAAVESAEALAPEAPALPRRRQVSFGAAAVASVLLVILSVGAFWYFRHPPLLTDKDSILIAEFDNSTGDPVFDGALRQALVVQLEQSPFLNIFSEDRQRETLRYMGRSPDERVGRKLALEICQRQDVKAVLTGAISSLGATYVVGLEAVNCRTGDALAGEQVQTESKEKVLDALGTAASRLRRKLGESLASIQKFDWPIEAVTTSSLEALKEWAAGSEAVRRGGHTRAIPMFERAIALDPNFAAAYRDIAGAYSNAGENEQAMPYAQKAYDLRERVSEQERFSIETTYHWIVTGDLDKEMEIERVWSEAYPRAFSPIRDLAFNYCFSFGQYAKAVELANQAIQIDPTSSEAYAPIGFAYLALNQLVQVKTILESPPNQNDRMFVHYMLYSVAYLQGDAGGMERQLQWSAVQPPERTLSYLVAMAAAQRGQLQKAREILTQEIRNLRRVGFKERAAGYYALLAIFEAEFGSFEPARQDAASSIGLTRGYNLYEGATAVALAGDSRKAESLLEELDKRFRADTLAQDVYIPILHAALELNAEHPAKAVSALEPARRFDMGVGQRFLPLYFRGLAYLSARQGQEAAAEFQKVIDHRGIYPLAPEWALAHLGLARADALSSQSARGADSENYKTKARAAYQDFLTLWKDADPDIPILRQAKAEYARLK